MRPRDAGTQDLLDRVVGACAPEVWRWLESRPYVRRGTVGLFLHDVVRELFEAEFAQRAPQAFTAMHRTVRNYFLERLLDEDEPHRDRAAAEILILHRKSPLVADTTALRDGGLVSVPRARPEDQAEIVRTIQAYEGSTEADLARRWMAEQPHGVYWVRGEDGPAGFAVQVYLPAPADLVADDPVVGLVLQAVEQHGPLRPGERVNINRFAGDSSSYQRDPMQLLANGVSCLLEWVEQPAAWTFIVTIDDDYYGPYFTYLAMRRVFQQEVFGRLVTGYGWDRRRLPVPDLLELMAHRELTGETGPAPPELLRPVPLSRPAFAAAVAAALPQVRRPDRLADSPLLGTALIPAGAGDPAAALRTSLLSAVSAMGAEPRGAEHERVLRRTYVTGAPSQEAAAEMLDLPFSTYRRHVSRAVERLVEILWAVEIGERRLDPDAGGQEVGSS